ncbi:MAG: hypothetical protein HY471_02620 [Candidatus Sungbacteria bacterium]|nr:hypothetical protein [Candidatus Sungbacteria bacterium]
MDYQTIAKWLTNPRERCIIVENGKPVLVIMGMEAYQELKGEEEKPQVSGSSTKDAADMVNAKLEEERLKARELAARLSMEAPRPEAALRAETSPRPEPVLSEPSRIRLEDLPL